jgi:hypothetical protein
MRDKSPIAGYLRLPRIRPYFQPLKQRDRARPKQPGHAEPAKRDEAPTALASGRKLATVDGTLAGAGHRVQPAARRSFFVKARDALGRMSQTLPLAAQDLFLQWFWCLTPVPESRIGFGDGPLTWLRLHKQRQLKRDVHIVFLQNRRSRADLAPLTAWAVNTNCKRCTATVNEGLERADIVWVYTQDPLHDDELRELEARIAARAPAGTPVINPPSSYGVYHAADVFPRLERAGVSVPRHELTEADEGVTRAVYKRLNMQGAAKESVIYDGPRPGYRAFEFIDSRGADGLHRRYRAHYLAGLVRPSEVFVGPGWNICSRTTTAIDYSFELTTEERAQIRLIAETLSLQYFAVDFVRCAGDGCPYFLDINVYPTIRSPRQKVRSIGDYGYWHTFDARARRGIPEPDGQAVWDAFDEAMVAFAEGSPLTLDCVA